MDQPKDKTEIGLAPSDDSPKQNAKKVKAGRGIMLFLACFTALMFSAYLAIVVYGISASG